MQGRTLRQRNRSPRSWVLVGLCRSQLILGKFAIREMHQRLVAQPSLGRVPPRLNFALGKEPVEVIA
jgi:hypothetical protein